MQMNANEFGKRLGIGVRVAGRIAQQRAQESARSQPAGSTGSLTPPASAQPAAASSSAQPDFAKPDRTTRGRELGENSQQFARAAGRGVGGFLRPFRRVGGILWLEVTGFFFGLVALYFAIDLWRNRTGYAPGALHTHFLIDVGAAILFTYFCVSAFWRAGRK